jgi:endonuclease YncB( thermonuclease family)
MDGPYPVAVTRVIDGDTFEGTISIPLWFNMTTTVLARIRPRGYDTAERQARCPAEREWAIAATAALARLLEQTPVVVQTLVPDMYGRVIADVTIGEPPVSLSDAMLAAGYARPYGTGRQSWCD